MKQFYSLCMIMLLASVLAIDVMGQKTTLTVTGKVTDLEGDPLSGVSVVVQGTTRGTITNIDGAYSINVPSKQSVLVFSMISMKTVDHRVGNSTQINIIMEEDVIGLGDVEVVAIGYGSMRRSDLTGSISSISKDALSERAITSLEDAMRGKAAGMQIVQNDGAPGSDYTIRIRGASSVNASSAPIFVIDGVICEDASSLNPGDVASIEILKDASSTAIYGSRANAGVVLITTKSGQQGKTKIEVSGRYGFAYLASDIEMANSMEYMNTMQAAIDNYNVQMGANLQLYVPSQIQETNWVKEISRKNSKTGTGSISISGGNEKTTFFASLGANTQEGYLNKSSYDQYNMRAKFTHKINNLFKLNLNLAGSASRSDLLEETSTSLKVLRTAREEQPWYSPYKEDGTSYKVNGTDILRHNPVMLINEEDWVAKKYQLSGVFSVDVTPFKGFKYTPTVSVYGILDNTSKNCRTSMMPVKIVVVGEH